MTQLRPRPWPDPLLTLPQSVLGYFEFLHTTSVNKVLGLTEQQARQCPLATSPVVSPLGLLQHLTAVYRQHIQIHIGGSELPSLWRSGDITSDFLVAPDDTISSVIAAYDAEWARSVVTLAGVDWQEQRLAYGKPTRIDRLLVDVQQECARHLGHLDIVRELIDGATGE